MKLLQYLQTHKYILLDGAMGTELDKRGIMGRGRNNVDHPEAVLEVHRAYIAAGCQAVTTNTLTMNRIYIESHNVDVNVEEVNRAGVDIALEAAEGKVFVLGDMSSTGQLLEPYGMYKEQQFYDTFKEQAEILAASGVDAFIIETVFDLREAVCAVKACKDNCDLPVLVTPAFQTEQKGGRTVMGNTAADCAKQLTDSGADGVGANCGDIDPAQMAEIIAIMKENTALPLIAQPNAGKPKLVDDKTIFDMTAEPFAAGIQQCLAAGTTIVGGCCGTTPAHIKKVAEGMNLS
jgi:5-methyltetrahydrofolate--homocysteine methyltransferase